MVERVRAFESETVATVEIEAVDEKELHRRYRIEGVPMVVLADAEGVVRAGFVGAVERGELENALDDAQAASA